MYRDLPYYKGIRVKHAVNINFMKTSMKIMQTVYIPIEDLSQVIASGSFKHWLIHHSMESAAIYSSRECGAINNGGPSLDSRNVKNTSRRSSSLDTK